MAFLPGLTFHVDSWDEFTVQLALLTERDRGTAFEHVVRHYLRSDPKYRTKLAHVWFHHEIPAKIRASLRLPERDMGIDLVAQTHTGDFWAIQAKFRTDADSSLTFAELSTFSSLAFHVCQSAFAFALVCTTTARIPGILRNLENLGDLTAEIWSELRPEFFASLRDSFVASTSPPHPAPHAPQKHQHAAIAAARAHYLERGHARGKLISPCGSGKSLTAYWIARDLAARRVLIAVPSLALVRQTLETWMREALADNRPVDWLCVCSDDEVTRVDRAETVAHVHELGIPCDTAPAALAAHLATLCAAPGILVVLTTYQSSPVLTAATRAAGFAFDFAVLDEAHKTTGRAAGVFAHLLDDANLPLPRRLFMTATERRFSGTSDDIVSMDDPELYGETFSLLTFKAAIAAEPAILCDYRILTIGVRQSEIAALVAANRWLDLGPDADEVTALALASLIALRRATVAHGVRHTVSFHSSIARARDFQTLCHRLNAHLATESPIAAYHVSGKLGSAARQREIKQFLAAAPSLITNARCLTEGVDVPRIDCVFFADPKGSTIEIVQAAGRALRLAAGKERGYILLPLVVPDGATLDEVTASSAFKFVMFVLRALAAHDERIIEWFRATAEGRTPEVGGLVDFDFANVVAPLGVNAEEFAKQIEVKCWESVAILAPRPYEEAAIFARSLGVRTFRQYWAAVKRLKEAGEWPADIPAQPSGAYHRSGWIGWGDFLATGRKSTRRSYSGGRGTWCGFEEARAWARTLGLKSSDEWRLFCNGDFPEKGTRPKDIPFGASQYYAKNGWVDWDDFLGIDWMPFDQARAFARSLKFTGQRQWKRYCKDQPSDLPPKPEGIPASPWYAYEDRGWAGWRDWLGTERPALEKPAPTTPMKPRVPRKPRPSRFRDFGSARAFAHSLQLESSTQWHAYLNKQRPEKPELPPDVPRNPRNVYEEHWQGWGDWLGTGNVAPFRKVFRPFAEARAFARTLGLRTGEDWNVWCRVPGNRPPDIPSKPDITYKTQGFTTYSDFLQAAPSRGDLLQPPSHGSTRPS